MPRADTPTDVPGTAIADEPPGRAPRSLISVALLSGLAFMPIVVAVGFLMDRSEPPSVPGDIGAVALRGAFDGEATPQRPRPARAEY